MSADRRLSFTPNLVIGLGIMVLGVVLMFDRLAILDAQAILRFWPVLLILFGAAVVAQAWRGEVPRPGEREQPIISPGLVFVLVIAFLLVTQAQRSRADRPRETDADTVSIFAIMSRDERVSHATGFQGGEMTTVMGRSELDLRQATIAPGEDAVIDVFGLMGGLVIRVPPGWVVDVQSAHVFGGVRDRRGQPPQEAEADTTPDDALERADTAGDPAARPRVVVRGFIMMGRLEIRS